LTYYTQCPPDGGGVPGDDGGPDGPRGAVGPEAGYCPGVPEPPPLPPQNVEVVSPYLPCVLDLRWDCPATLAGNSLYTVVGVNIYRSDVSDRGPYFRLNQIPIGGTFYRDLTYNERIVREVVLWDEDWISRGDAANNRRWQFRTKQPIVKRECQTPHGKPVAADQPTDVTVYIDGIECPVEAVLGPACEITLVNMATIDVARQRRDAPLLPNENSVVEVTYHTSRNFVRSGLESVLYYRLTTVIVDPTTPSGYRETPLAYTPAAISAETETLDYIWREAVRRNQWILQQGGERVKFFIRRRAGIPCTHGMDPRTVEFGGQPSNRCEYCYGTGYIGGYEGPFDGIIAPDDAERKVTQTSQGRTREHTQEVWTGRSPVLTMRDFIVKQTNERYSIGPVRRPTNRGTLLQQHFTTGALDEGDIRYRVPINAVETYPWPQNRWTIVQTPTRFVDGYPPTLQQRLINGIDARYTLKDKHVVSEPGAPPFPIDPTAEGPMGTENGTSPPELEQRGRTTVWSNISR
jgi:hypothetical protein